TTGLPSGQGIASKNVYFLPLHAAAATGKPEICVIDTVKQDITAHTKSRKNEVPGNLVFYQGDVISQSVRGVAAYPQLEVRLKELDGRIAKNDKAPEALTARGELRLDKGDLKGAVEDLVAAMDNKPPDKIVDKTRLTLYEALTDYFARDFNTAEKKY